MRQSGMIVTFAALAVGAWGGCSSSTSNGSGSGTTSRSGDGGEDGGEADSSSLVDASNASADGGPSSADAGPSCLGNVDIDFSSLSPYWVDVSTSCGTATFAANAVEVSRSAAATCGVQFGGWVQLDDKQWQVCGDFDIRVDYSWSAFSTASGTEYFAGVEAFDPSSNNDGIAIERLNGKVSQCVPSDQSYKSWIPPYYYDCQGPAFVPTSDRSGRMRLTRVGASVTSYLWTSDDGGDGTWLQVFSAQNMTTLPWSLQIYMNASGNSDTSNQAVSFSNLVIQSATSP